MVEPVSEKPISNTIKSGAYLIGLQRDSQNKETVYRFPIGAALNAAGVTIEGGGGSCPQYVLEWHEGTDIYNISHPTASEIASNREVIVSINSETSPYLLYLDVGDNLIPCSNIGEHFFTFTDVSPEMDRETFYRISRGTPYTQEKSYSVETDEFDEDSELPPSQKVVADYIESRLGDIADLISEL